MLDGLRTWMESGLDGLDDEVWKVGWLDIEERRK